MKTSTRQKHRAVKFAEREFIWDALVRHHRKDEIAKFLERSPSTLSHIIKRHRLAPPTPTTQDLVDLGRQWGLEPAEDFILDDLTKGHS